MMNFVYLLADKEVLCGTELQSIISLVGWVVLAIKIAIPIILIVVGMLGLSKAVMAKDDNQIKAAQGELVKKAVSAVAVFLVATIVGLLMNIIGSTEWKECAKKCFNTPWATGCSISGDIK